VALAVACGSTVQGTATGQRAAGELGGTGTQGGTALADGTQAAGAGVAGANGSAGGPAASGGAAARTTAGGGAFAGSKPNVSGPGVTDKEVYIGLIHDVNAGAANKAAGVGAITSGNDQANTQAIIDDINKHGGVGGRRLVPVYADFDSTSSQTLDSQYGAVCQHFTQDNPRVFAVSGGGDNESYRKCLSNAGVTMISSSLPSVGQATLARYPGFFEQGYPNVDRLAAYEVTPLVEQHYFTPWNNVTGQPAPTGAVKVGILTYNDIVFSSAVDHFLVPALRHLGYEPVVEKVAPITTYSDYGAQGAAVKSAQLSFASNGVTHVIMFESNGGLSTLFMPTARSQGYFPRYGESTASAAEALLEAHAADPSQMNGAVGFGWVPSLDLRGSDNPATGPYSNANRRYCLDVMRAHGITFDSGNAEGIALNSCSNLYLLKQVLDKTPSLINVSRFISIAESLGSSYQRAGAVGMEFGPNRHDPSNKAYHWHFVAGCSCMQYEGPAQTVP
jgi:hypothetical protein